MKVAVKNEIVNENRRKIFTKKSKNNIIMSEDYNPSNKGKVFYERKGFVMRETKDIVLKEITKELNYVEKIIVRIFFKTFIKVYNKARINAVNSMLK